MHCSVGHTKNNYSLLPFPLYLPMYSRYLYLFYSFPGGFDIMRQFFVIDHQDDIVLYSGTLENCETVVEENYAGLMIVGYRDLSPNMIKSLKDKTRR